MRRRKAISKSCASSSASQRKGFAKSPRPSAIPMPGLAMAEPGRFRNFSFPTRVGPERFEIDRMKFEPKYPPREFEVGYDVKGVIRDCGVMRLAPDEQITFLTEQGGEYDLTRKDWGFYATPSLNGRLASFNLRAVLVKNRLNRFFVMLVERGKEEAFERYVRQEPLVIVAWLDSEEALVALEKAVASR